MDEDRVDDEGSVACHYPLLIQEGIDLKLKLYAFTVILLAYSTALAETEAVLPAGSRIFFSEQDCVEAIKAHYSWNIEFSESLRDMEKTGKLIRYPHPIPITILERNNYKSRDYYKISIYDKQTEQQKIVWTDAVRFE